MAFASVGELNRHLEETGSQNAYLFTPIHFREQSVGYLVMKNGRFLYDNPYYYDIHSTIVRHWKRSLSKTAGECSKQTPDAVQQGSADRYL